MVEEARKRRARVVSLHQGGLSFGEIAKVMGLSRPGAWRLWKEAEKKGEVNGRERDDPRRALTLS